MITSKSSRADIREYQRVLQRAGFYWGEIDGLWGPLTQRANELYLADTAPAVSGAGVLNTIAANILKTAARFVGLTETKQNARWDDLLAKGNPKRGGELLTALQETGWQPGWAYCMAFGEVCWRAGYKGLPELALIGQSITPSVMGTFENFQELGRISEVPVPGALMLFQHGSTWQGHAAIVQTVLRGNAVQTIEGNTSPAPGTAEADREGDGVYAGKTRAIDFTPKPKGLWLRGFVNPFVVK